MFCVCFTYVLRRYRPRGAVTFTIIFESPALDRSWAIDHPSRMTLTILIPAAGASTRMRGGDKLLELVAGEPMLRRQARLARKVCAQVIVTLRQEDAARVNALHGLDIELLHITDANEGMSASLRAGAKQARGALIVLPGDMPEIDQADLNCMIMATKQFPENILRGASAVGEPGHPVIFPADLVPEFASLAADEGARRILQRHRDRIRLITLPQNHALTDLDTPEAWATWRAGLGG